ncbi:MAG: hypothetical protein Q7W45_01210 [Bacteroidota bacterium]|nr:hypothetical protein [Bacteroidota bacterium]MDP3146496.1 hypothetical protein [Bacteroidota bacterium]MDP3557650.1 hypothetical protein [Bacteroidota bacterium]
MRIIDSIPHQSMTISIFQMNDKYQVKFEAGPMEQIFKFSVEEVRGVENLKKLMNEDFIEKTRLRFNEMFMEMKSLN